MRSILGLENESLNNVEPMAEPERVGAGRARRFAAVSHAKLKIASSSGLTWVTGVQPAAFVGSSTNNTSNAGEGNRQRHSQQVGSGRPHQPGQDAASGNRNQPAIATLRQAAGTGALSKLFLDGLENLEYCMGVPETSAADRCKMLMSK